MFQQISEAYACLSDPEKKRQHDLGGMSMDDMTDGMGGMGGMGGGFPAGFTFGSSGPGMGGGMPNFGGMGNMGGGGMGGGQNM